MMIVMEKKNTVEAEAAAGVENTAEAAAEVAEVEAAAEVAEVMETPVQIQRRLGISSKWNRDTTQPPRCRTS